MNIRISSLFFVALFWALGLQAQKVYVLELKDEIHAPTARYMTKGVQAAKEADASLIIVHMDTYGGRVDHADSIRSALLDAGRPTAVFIDRNAASAGALISIACDSIFMAAGATIGAATVVDGGTGEAAPDKYQSYWRGIMRTTAEQKGRDPAIAEKMVDQKLDLPGISPAGQVITFSTREAIEHDYCDAEASSILEIAKKMGIENPEIVNYEGSTIDQLIIFLINPSVSSILMLMIFGGVFMEMKTPGVGFAGAIALVGISLFFAPHYIEGLAESWEIALFAVGIILMAAEIFVIPGFGVAGVLGIGATVGGLVAALLDNDGTSLGGVSMGDILAKSAWVLVLMISGILVVVLLARYLFQSSMSHPLVDHSAQKKEDGYTAVDGKIHEFIGEEGIALTDLRPSGYVEVNGQKLDANCVKGYINKGDAVRVEAVKSINVVVIKI